MPASPSKPPTTPPKFPSAGIRFDETTTISPSKARARAHQLHQISLVKSWLTSLFETNPTPAQYEAWESELVSSTTSDATASSTHAVLEALQDLQALNQSADKLNKLLDEARENELQNLKTRETFIREQPVSQLRDGLEAQMNPAANEALSSLAQSLVILGIPPTESVRSDETLIVSIANYIVTYTLSQQTRESRSRSISSLQADLQVKVENTRDLLQELQDSQIPDNQIDRIHSQTTQWNREAKQILSKIAEYNERIVLLNQNSKIPNVKATMSDILDMQTAIFRRKENIAALERRLHAFRGLPSDLAASREEVRRATDELDGLKAKRAELFEQTGSN